MKIGILTLHSQLNYGGVLQCWALQTALEQMGHEVVVIDRWLDEKNSRLNLPFQKCRTRSCIRFALRTLLGTGEIHAFLRVQRTKRFLNQFLHLTKYHFVEWCDAPIDLGIETIIVGSDQVWHCGDWGDPSAYLLQGCPNVRAIAYAASFGMPELPKYVDGVEDVGALYRLGLSRFAAISCREADGVKLCSKLGFLAEHVVDPTLLLSAKDWRRLLVPKKIKQRRKLLVCYFINEDILRAFPLLESFAKRNECRVMVFLGNRLPVPVPISKSRLSTWWAIMKYRFSRHVHIYDSAGPLEFINMISGADWIVGDSFHALMFSIVFEKNVRILEPTCALRKRMFSRIAEVSKHIKGRVLSENIKAALSSIEQNETVVVDQSWVLARKSESATFLSSNLL